MVIFRQLKKKHFELKELSIRRNMKKNKIIKDGLTNLKKIGLISRDALVVTWLLIFDSLLYESKQEK